MPILFCILELDLESENRLKKILHFVISDNVEELATFVDHWHTSGTLFFNSNPGFGNHKNLVLENCGNFHVSPNDDLLGSLRHGWNIVTELDSEQKLEFAKSLKALDIRELPKNVPTWKFKQQIEEIAIKTWGTKHPY